MAQSAAPFSVLFRGHMAMSSASMVRISRRIWVFVYAVPPSSPIQSASVDHFSTPAAVYASSNFCKAASRIAVRVTKGGYAVGSSGKTVVSSTTNP